MSEGTLLDSDNKYICGEIVELIHDCSVIKSPIMDGQVKDFQLLEKVFESVCEISTKQENKKLNEENMVFMTSGIRWDLKTYSKIMEFFFEKMGYNEIGFGLEGISALYQYGKENGLVFDSGDTLTKVFPVINGYINFDAVKSVETSGEDVTKYLRDNLTDCFSNQVFIQKYIDYIKETHCFVSQNLEQDFSKIKNEVHELPDGATFSIGSESFLSSEILFNDMGANSLQSIIVECLDSFSYYGNTNFRSKDFT